jgi:predicted nucleotidyltransferase
MHVGIHHRATEDTEGDGGIVSIHDRLVHHRTIIRGMTAREIVQHRLGVEPERIDAFCRKWRIRELSLFGSALRDDFRPDSDVDLLVVFEPDAGWDLWNIIEMEEELEQEFGRKVDLVEKRALKNPFRRYDILTTRQVLFAA